MEHTKDMSTYVTNQSKSAEYFLDEIGKYLKNV